MSILQSLTAVYNLTYEHIRLLVANELGCKPQDLTLKWNPGSNLESPTLEARVINSHPHVPTGPIPR